MNYKNSSYKHTECDENSIVKSPAKDDRYQYIYYCYSNEAVQNIDFQMVNQGFVENSYTLMLRAAKALFNFINHNYSHIENISIVCGAGNNAGDGYALARLLKLHEKEPQIKVRLISIIDPENLAGDAHTAYLDWLDCDGTVELMADSHFSATDLIVDALIGTGLNRPLEDEWYDTVAAINNSCKPVLAVDIPSGLDADSGASYGITIEADHTVTFIAQKMGMYTAQARNYCGKIHFASLGVDDSLYEQIKHHAILMEWNNLLTKLPSRNPISNKGEHGHLLIIGGDYGMAGACLIAGEAALRAGAGLVSIATRKENTNAITSARPELMVHGIEHADELELLLKKATAIAIGPGLGTKQWGVALLNKIIKFIKQQYRSTKQTVHCVFDADALNIMAQHNWLIQSDEIIYTPHFAEATRLLKYKSELPTIDNNRFDMIIKLQKKYHGIFVLKGPGTLVNIKEDTAICPYGNAGMASAGMGDSLTGIIGALLAQKVSIIDSACLGVCLHAKAGDLAAKEGKNGMLVSDLFPKIRKLMNH